MRILIIGAGGHARVVADMLLQARQHGAEAIPVGFLDDNPLLAGLVHFDLPVIGPLTRLDDVPHDGVVVAIGDNDVRRHVSGVLEARGEFFATVRHPSSSIAPDVTVGPGSMIGAGVVITTGVRIGRGCIVNTRAVIEHDSIVGDWAHVAPGAVLGGNVCVGNATLIGLGVAVLPGRSVGAHSIVGGGGVVTKSLPDQVVAVGVPARVLRRRPSLQDEALAQPPQSKMPGRR